MGRIVSGGVRRQVLEPTKKPAPGETWVRKQIVLGRGPNAIRLAVFGRNIEQVDANVATIQEHFGVNKTTAFKIALHLVAKGIKEGRFNA